MINFHIASTPVRLATLAATSALLVFSLSACNSRTDSQSSPVAVQPAPATAPTTTPMAEARSDTLITADLKVALLADDMVKGLDIGVTTNGGEVLLTGTIDNQAQRDQALVVARRIEGVRLVRDETTLRN